MNQSTPKRAVIEFGSTLDSFDQGSMDVTSGDHGVTFEITDIQAVDSYNEEFTCRSCLSRKDAVRLRDWLTEILS